MSDKLPNDFPPTPSIDDPKLAFAEVEDVPMAYFPQSCAAWRILSDNTLRPSESWPTIVDISHNGCRISKEEALKLASSKAAS